MKLHIAMMYDETDAPGATYTLQLPGAPPLTLHEKSACCILNVNADGSKEAITESAYVTPNQIDVAVSEVAKAVDTAAPQA